MPGSANTAGKRSHTACNYSSTGDLAASMLVGSESIWLFATARGNQSNNSDPGGNTRTPGGDTRTPGGDTRTPNGDSGGDTRTPGNSGSGGDTHTPGGNTRTPNDAKGLPTTRS